LKKAHKERSAAETNMNEKSSRSHLILTVTISTFDERDQTVTSAKLNIVDLAGSERVKLSQVQGQQLKEACYINKSLDTLAAVVDAVQKGVKKQGQIRYRESKLTMILKDSIGGNCRTTLLAMLSPSQEFSRES